MWESIGFLFLISPYDLLRTIVAMVLSLALAMGAAHVYKRTHTGMSYEPSFVSTLVLLAPIVSVVMLFIQGDLVISLGLVGSLSIIRFRTPIKDTRDMVFLFWVIAIGLGTGTYNWTLALVASGLLTVCVLVLHAVRYERTSHSEYILVIAGEATASFGGIGEIVNRHASLARIRSHEVQGDRWERVFELQLTKGQQLTGEDLVEELSRLEGIAKVSFLAPQLSLPA